ncbi:hypothetical protein ACWEKM_38540 [Streptomyces sp. NPDC004752]
MDASLTFESFLEGAKKAAHKAMDDHGRGEYDEFALHAGVAIERLAKAVLVSKNPVYIVEMRGSAEMLFHLGGHRTASKVRTIGAVEAISRVRTLGILPVDRQLDLLRCAADADTAVLTREEPERQGFRWAEGPNSRGGDPQPGDRWR